MGRGGAEFLKPDFPLELAPSALRQAFSWSSEEDEPVLLGEFIAAKAPETVKVLNLTLPLGPRKHVKKIAELDTNELKKVVCARLKEGMKDLRLFVIGQGGFSADDLIAQVNASTDLGRRLVCAEKRGLLLIEQQVEAGDVRIVEEETHPSVKRSDFEF